MGGGFDMHYYVLAILGPTNHPEAKLDELLKPFYESEYDWYQIGGRYTGMLTGYKPSDDPKNVEVCEQCKGTGDNKNLEPPEWKKQCGGCNGCRGKGVRAKWPTDWERYSGDIQQVSDVEITEANSPYAFVVGDKWVAPEAIVKEDGKYKSRDNNKFGFQLEEALKNNQDGIVVVVDCHN